MATRNIDVERVVVAIRDRIKILKEQLAEEKEYYDTEFSKKGWLSRTFNDFSEMDILYTRLEYNIHKKINILHQISRLCETVYPHSLPVEKVNLSHEEYALIFPDELKNEAI